MKKVLQYLALALLPFFGMAQVNPFTLGLYNGANTWSVNPAYSSVQKGSLQIGASNLQSYNNLGGLGAFDVVNSFISETDLTTFTQIPLSQLQSLNFSGNVLNAQSHPITFTKKIKKVGFGICTEVNTNIMELQNINFPFLSLFSNLLDVEDIINNGGANIGDVNLNATFKPMRIKPINNYNKISGNFSYEILNTNKFMLNAGGAINYYNSVIASDFRLDKLNAQVKSTEDSIYVTSAGIEAQMLYALPVKVSNLDYTSSLTTSNIFSSAFGGAGRGFGGDIGVTFAYKGSEIYRKLNKSPYRIIGGIAIMDMGNLNVSGNNTHGTLKLSGNGNIALPFTAFDSITTFNQAKQFFETNGFTAVVDSNSRIAIALPTRMVLHADAHIWKNIYTGLLTSIPLANNTTTFSLTQAPTFISIIPRMEMKNFSVQVPLQYDNKTTKPQVGLGLALGFFRLGCADLSGAFSQKNLNFYVAVANTAR
jgi:hypothetical protein